MAVMMLATSKTIASVVTLFPLVSLIITRIKELTVASRPERKGNSTNGTITKKNTHPPAAPHEGSVLVHSSIGRVKSLYCQRLVAIETILKNRAAPNMLSIEKVLRIICLKYPSDFCTGGWFNGCSEVWLLHFIKNFIGHFLNLFFFFFVHFPPYTKRRIIGTIIIIVVTILKIYNAIPPIDARRLLVLMFL